MKKLIYSLILALLSFSALTSCTEEEVKPQVESNNTGGSAIKE